MQIKEEMRKANAKSKCEKNKESKSTDKVIDFLDILIDASKQMKDRAASVKDYLDKNEKKINEVKGDLANFVENSFKKLLGTDDVEKVTYLEVGVVTVALEDAYKKLDKLGSDMCEKWFGGKDNGKRD